ncbi:RagB/SusD family nutrient uptake outer membrane protein [Seonamhaeicola sp.]|uniref:RagB/SusD family nutrient uptake outer membrane protein n=1 Tax=Seonamhaeicola sp. TaxID=1912245 RepID=UPI002609402D|nr:RagB/SusD family nutrient uptake outer membrane protein [Seonamhaeicola sp.]
MIKTIINHKEKVGVKTIVMSIVVFTSVIMSSCSEDILNKQPLADISDGDIFNDDALLDAYVLGNYRAFRFFQFGAFFPEVGTDNAMHVAGGGGLQLYARNQHTADNSEDFTQNAWRENYSNIRRANIYFDRIANTMASPDLVQKLTAEMRFIRAWCYFDLISFYGDIPLITDLVDLGAAFDRTRTPYDEVSAFIVSELDAAIPDLPTEAFDGNTGRATRGAAMALKSRVLLYAASALHNPTNDLTKWQAASDAAEAAMDLPEYSIDPDYSNIYNEVRSQEVMFARGYTNENRAANTDLPGVWTWNFVIDRYYLPANYFVSDPRFTMAIQNLVDAYETQDGSPVDPQDPWTNRDPRLDMTIIHHNSVINKEGSPITIEYHYDQADPSNAALAGLGSNLNGGTVTHYNIIKQTDTSKPLGLENPDHHAPWVYFRKAEMYLNYAEAQIELGNEANARMAINKVRSRTNVDMPDVTDSGVALKQRYRNERRVEFAFENLRWYDITRWKIGDQVIKPAIGLTILRDNTTNPPTETYQYDRVVDEFRTWDDRMYYMPIPRAELEASPSLLPQNPGY